MKKTILSIVGLAISYLTFAQAPQSFQYQAVVRDINGVALINQPVDFQLSIILGLPTNPAEYVETHTDTTNNFGIVTLSIGNGTVVSGIFSAISWGTNSHFLKVEADLGSGLINMGTTQLLSVPYALYSETAGNVTMYTAGNGISIAGNVITNTAPDQIVNLTGAGSTSVTGIYPNFTINSTDANTTYSAGTGIDVTGTTITNTAPDQPVAITGTGATSVTGTYPNFTISSTDNVNDADADATNEIQVLSISNDTMYLSNGGSVFMGNYSDTLWKKSGNSIYNTNSDNVGVGINNPVGRMVVQGSATALPTDPLFEVKNSLGQSVFVVWQDSVQVYINDDAIESNRGGFAVSGRNMSKAFTNNYLKVTPDSSRIWTKDTLAGFGVQNINGSNKTNYMQLTPNNYFIGHESGLNITSGLYNNFFGYQAGYSDTSGSNNVANGYQALYSNTSGIRNTAEGYQALYSNTTGSYNTANGFGALYSNTFKDNNTAYGYKALYSSTTGEFNTACGTDALRFNTTGRYNTALGYSAFYSGIYDNSMALGNDAIVNASNKVVVGNSSISSAWVQVAWTIGSDSRIKKNVQDDIPGIEFIKLLKPVTYNYDILKENSLLGIIDTATWEGKHDIEKIRFSGFLAQEVDAAAKTIGYDFSGVDKSGILWGLRYAEFTVPLVKAVQELNAKSDDQQKLIENQNIKIQNLENENAQLKTKTNEIYNLKSEIELIKTVLGASAKK